MIFGIGTDICKVSRFLDKVCDIENQNSFITRYFNSKEIKKDFATASLAAQYYASRFAAKEAFSKALGTGIRDFCVKDVYVTNDEKGKPILNVENTCLMKLQKIVKNYKIHLSLSHEKEFAQAFVVIEQIM